MIVESSTHSQFTIQAYCEVALQISQVVICLQGIVIARLRTRTANQLQKQATVSGQYLCHLPQHGSCERHQLGGSCTSAASALSDNTLNVSGRYRSNTAFKMSTCKCVHSDGRNYEGIVFSSVFPAIIDLQ
jgi:hypothetical protein